MASAGDILVVKTNLPEDSGWSDEQIGQLIDALGTTSKVVQSFWSAKAAELYRLHDVSESGSSRNLSVGYTHAMEMLQRWDKIVEDETKKEESVGAVRFGRISRSFPS